MDDPSESDIDPPDDPRWLRRAAAEWLTQLNEPLVGTEQRLLTESSLRRASVLHRGWLVSWMTWLAAGAIAALPPDDPWRRLNVALPEGERWITDLGSAAAPADLGSVGAWGFQGLFGTRLDHLDLRLGADGAAHEVDPDLAGGHKLLSGPAAALIGCSGHGWLAAMDGFFALDAAGLVDPDNTEPVDAEPPRRPASSPTPQPVPEAAQDLLRRAFDVGPMAPRDSAFALLADTVRTALFRRRSYGWDMDLEWASYGLAGIPVCTAMAGVLTDVTADPARARTRLRDPAATAVADRWQVPEPLTFHLDSWASTVAELNRPFD